MRNLTCLALMGFMLSMLMVSCEKDPDMDKLDNQYIVKTNYKKGTDFRAKSTYFIGDTVYVIDGSQDQKLQKWVYGSDARASKIIDAIKGNLNEKGYQAQTDTTGVDMAVLVTYFKDVEAFYGFDSDYWWDYWGYWGGWYWDWYPYPVYPMAYVYQLGSVEMDIIDTKAKSSVMNGKQTKPIIWSSYATGLNSGNDHFDQQLVLQSINQSFAQSTYLTKK